jgi:hypothetical protein
MAFLSSLNPFGGILGGLQSLRSNMLGGFGLGALDPTPRQAPTASYPSSYTSDDLPGDARARGAATVAPAPAPAPAMAGKNEIENYIIQSAQARGIDPSYALRVARAEGGTKLWNRQSDVVKNGKRERSYGPFQLYLDGGLGNKALAAGIDPRDPRHGKAAIDFALDEVARDGWRQWYGAKAVGIGRWDGVKGAKPTGKYASADPLLVAGRADGPKGEEVYPRRGPAPTVLAQGLPDEMPPPGTQRIPGSKPPMQGSGSKARVVAEDGSATQAPQEPRTPVGMAFQQYKVNRSTRMLRSLGPAATIGVLAAIGSDARLLREQAQAREPGAGSR